VGVITEMTGPLLFKEVVDGAQAAAKAIDASGGIDGHPLKVISCDTQGVTDPTQGELCARNLVGNPSILAEIGDINAFGEQITTILNAAHVPAIAPIPFYPAQLTDPDSFPFEGPEPAAQGVVLADQGSKTICLAYYGVNTAGTVTLNNLALKSRGLQIIKSIPVPITATDMSPYVAAAAGKCDGVALGTPAEQTAAWLKTARQGNYPQKVSATAVGLNPAALSQLGSYGQGLYVASGLPFPSDTSIAGVARYNQEMNAYNPSAFKDEDSLNAWLGTWAFAQVAETIKGPLTRASVLSAWSNLTNFNVFGMLPNGFTTTKPAVSLPGFNRQFNPDIYEGEDKNGQLVAVSGYVPVFTSK
jgi:ABC-type branched-subunit amino acid transport system substrate-binding protein